MTVPGKIHDKHVRGFFMKVGLSQAKIPQKMDRYGKCLSFSLAGPLAVSPSLDLSLFLLSVRLSFYGKFSRIDVDVEDGQYVGRSGLGLAFEIFKARLGLPVRISQIYL